MFNFFKWFIKTIFTLILVGGILYYIWANYEFLSKYFINQSDNSQTIFNELNEKYVVVDSDLFKLYQKNEANLNKLEFNIEVITTTILNLNIQNQEKAKLLLFYQSLNDYDFKLKNYEFDKFEDGFKVFRDILKENQCILSNIDLNSKVGEKSLKELLLIEPIYALIKETILRVTMFNVSDFKAYKSELLLRIVASYMSDFLNLIYSDNLCKNEEVLKLYKELKDRELKISPPIEHKKDKDLSLKDLLFGGKK